MYRQNRPFAPILTLSSTSAPPDNEDPPQPSPSAELMVKPLRSTKNQFQIKQDLFRSNKAPASMPRKYSLALDQLQKQNQQLLESIHILKNSAISAIAEKDDHIQTIKEGSLIRNEEELDLYEQILTKTISTQKQLLIDNQQLHTQLRDQRAELTALLEQKQAKIYELIETMNDLRNYTDQLQSNEQKLLQELKYMSQQVAYLSQLTQAHTLGTVVEECKKRADLDQTKPPPATSVASTIQNSKSGNNLLDALHINDLSVSIQKKYNERMHELNARHYQELGKMKQFYQKKIDRIRDIYNAYIADESQNYSILDKQNGIDHKFQDGLYPKCLDKVIYKGQDPLIPIEKCINRCKSSKEHWQYQDHSSQFQPIERISQPSVHNLNEQINFIPECFSLHRQDKNHELSSQFTKQHLQNPFLFHKQRSSASFKSTNKCQPVEIICKKQDHSCPKSGSKSQQKIKNPQQKQNIFWQKACAFATGLISGISITSLVALALKKKKFARIFLLGTP